jgi:WD40 repeat protein/beta-lactamase regulating signal transducer with metallopeptidase domain
MGTDLAGLDASADFLLHVFVRATVFLLFVGLLHCLLSRSAAASAAAAVQKHAVWTFGLVGAASLPVALCWLPSLAVPAWQAPFARPQTPPARKDPDTPPRDIRYHEPSDLRVTSGPVSPVWPDTPISAATQTRPRKLSSEADLPRVSIHWQGWAVALWLGVAMLAAVYNAVSWVMAWRMVRQSGDFDHTEWNSDLCNLSQTLEIRRRIALKQTSRPFSPLTWGIRRPVIVLPPGCEYWPADFRRVVLAHELAHVRRLDFATLNLSRVASIFYWFHPLVWIATRQQRWQADLAADALALHAGSVKPTRYAEILFTLARSLRSPTRSVLMMPAMARSSRLHDRIASILDCQADMPPSAKRRLAANGLLVLSALVVTTSVTPWVDRADAELFPAIVPGLGERSTPRPAGESLPPGAVAQLGSSLLRHAGHVQAVAFLPDGQRLISAAPSEVCVWDVATRKRLMRIPTRSGWVRYHSELPISPDGRTIAIPGPTHTTLEIWEVESGKRLQVLDARGRGGILAMAWSPDGEKIATGDAENAIRVWNWRSAELACTLANHLDHIRDLQFARDGTLWSVSQDRTIRHWDLPGGTELSRIHFKSQLYGAKFYADGTRLAFVQHDSLKILDLSTGSVELEVPLAHPTYWMAVSSDAAYLALSIAPPRSPREQNQPSELAVWDLAKQKKVATITASAGASPVSFSPDGRQLALATDHCVEIWNWRGNERVHPPAEFAGSMEYLAAGEEWFATAEEVVRHGSGAVRLWELKGGAIQERKALRGENQRALRLAASRHAPLVAATTQGPMGQVIRVWWATDGSVFAEIDSTDYTLALAPTRWLLATAGTSDEITLWDLAAGKVLGHLREHWGSVQCLAFAADGRTLASGSTDRMVVLWDVQESLPRLVLGGAKARIAHVSISDNSQTVAAVDGDGAAYIWDGQSGELLQHLVPDDGHEHDAASVAPHGRYVALAYDNRQVAAGTIRLVDTKSGALLVEFAVADRQWEARSLVHASDGKTLISGGSDGTILCWDVSNVSRGEQP